MHWTITEANDNDVMTITGTVPTFNRCRACNVPTVAILTLLSILLMYCTMSYH
jgi:hypothetical protein